MQPIIFHLGPLEIRLYGILFALALAQGIFLFKKFARQKGLNEKFIDSYLFWLALSIIIGARLGEVLLYEPAYYFSHPLEIFAVWHGGLASHGALIAGIITTFFFARKLKTTIPYTLYPTTLLLADLAAIPIALGAALVRIANFFNAEIVGTPTTLPWGVLFQGYEAPRHPVQLYEAGALIATFFILLLIKKRERGFSTKNKTAEVARARCPAIGGTSATEPLRPASRWAKLSLVVRGENPSDTLFFSFLFLYLSSRFFLEFLKDFPHYAGLTTAQWLSMPFIIFALTLLLKIKKKAQRDTLLVSNARPRPNQREHR